MPSPPRCPARIEGGDTSVVLCTHASERWDSLVEAVSSLRRQTIAPGEIIVVVDHNPELLQRARAEFQGVIVAANSGPPGLSGARNVGLNLAAGRIVAFLDDDAVALPNWIACLADGYSDNRVAALGGSVDAEWVDGRPVWFPREFDWVVGCSHPGMPTTLEPVRNLIGANMSFRRDILTDVGGFNVDLGRTAKRASGCEETELCIRIAALRPAARIVYDPAVSVSHRVPAARATLAYFTTRCFQEGRSKAVLCRLVGVKKGLAAERAYTTRTLAGALLASLLDPRPPVWAGLARAGAMLTGLLTTTAGYVSGRIFLRLSAGR
jgi:GT2 family glycosyltransferase